MPQEADGRLRSDVFSRNNPPIVAALTPWLASRTGPVLEVGAGTGQHSGAFALAFSGLEWWASDPDAGHRVSIAAWRRHLRLDPREPLNIDAASDWAAAVADVGSLAAVVSINVIHISPYVVAKGIITGAGRTLSPGGLLIFYGPFMVNGRFIGEGNETFDAGLRAENPAWGLRDTVEIEELAGAAGLEFAALQAMPANNSLLILRKN